MVVDSRQLARHVAAHLLIRACAVAVVVGIAFARSAWGQALDVPPVPAGAHPVDWLSALYGSGGTGAIVAVVIAVLWVLNKAGVPIGITVGKKSVSNSASGDDETSEAIRATGFVALDSRLDVVEKEQARISEAVKHMQAGQSRTLLEVQGVRDLAQQILLRQMGGKNA